MSSPFKWHIKFKIELSSPFKWHVMFKLGRPPFKETRLGCHLPSNDILSSSWVVHLSKRQDWVVISLQMTCYVQVGSSAFQRDRIGSSSPFKWHVKFKLGRPPFKETWLGSHLSSNDILSSSWGVHLSKRHDGFSSPFKWHIKFKLGCPPFNETRWVVTSFKVICYVQIGSSCFQRDALGCHLIQSNMLFASSFFQKVHHLHCAILQLTSKGMWIFSICNQSPSFVYYFPPNRSMWSLAQKFY